MRKNILFLLFLAVYSVVAVSQRYPTVHRRATPAINPPQDGPGDTGDTGNTGGTGSTGNTGNSGNSQAPDPPPTTPTIPPSTPTTPSTPSPSSPPSSSPTSSTSSSPTSSSTKTDSSASQASTSAPSTPGSSSNPSTPTTNPPPSSQSDSGASAPEQTSSPGGSSSGPSTTPSNGPSQGTSTSDNASNNNDSSVPIGTIIGLSVAGGVAVLAFVAFLIWKLTRKRFHDLDVDEAIKWPDVSRDHSSNVGYATGPSTDNLSRQISPTHSAPSRDYIPETNDPYAVPPLPQYNPNLPYRDDPHAAGYYDPYRGPVPRALYEGSIEGHENIPLNTLPNNTRTRSPAPGAALDITGRGSPVPGALGYQVPGGTASAVGQSGSADYRGY